MVLKDKGGPILGSITFTMEDRIRELEMRIIKLESEMRLLKSHDLFYYTWDSAEKTMKYTGAVE